MQISSRSIEASKKKKGKQNDPKEQRGSLQVWPFPSPYLARYIEKEIRPAGAIQPDSISSLSLSAGIGVSFFFLIMQHS